MIPPHILWERGALRLLDQRALPAREEWVSCKTWREVAEAIKNMTVRGAPLIGVAGAFGCALAAGGASHSAGWREEIGLALDELAQARPTAVNLAWAVARMREDLPLARSASELADIWLSKALALQKEDEETCRAIGKAGEALVPQKASVLTHCNAGALATAGYGTALGVIRAAREAGKQVRVYADETRPMLQGARLTAWELSRDGIPVEIACDNAAARLMSEGLVDLVIVGADRIAANGDAANKIGTLGLAIAANYYNVPFYVAAPLSTFDPDAPDASAIPIEQRAPEEVLKINGQSVAPAGVGAINFAFDATPATLITGLITEKGILTPPYPEAIARALSHE